MSNEPDRPDAETQWDAYSDYQHVSRRVAKRISDATDAIQTINGAKKAGIKIQPANEKDLRADVMSAVTRLQTELENERESNETYDEILSRWHGEEGFIERFETMSVLDQRPEPWLNEFAADINRAGWELGYLKAGSETKDNSGGEKDDSDIQELFEEMTV
jgi:hypothetical protein